MYERFRGELAAAIAQTPACTVETVLRMMDKVASRYEIKMKETALAVYMDGLPELAKLYLVCKKMAGLSDTTLKNYRIVLGLFFDTVQKLPEQVTTNDIRLFLYSYQAEKECSLRTLDKYREYISRFFSWTHSEGHIQTNPAKNVSPIKYEEKPREALSQIELEHLRMACKTDKERAIIEFLYSTGCRVSELSVVKKSDVDWNEKSVRLFGKGKKHRVSFLNAKAEVTLRKYLDGRKDECEYIFASSRRPFRQMHKDGIEKIVRTVSARASDKLGRQVTPHVLRHTTATTALRSGMPIEDISKLLGHESIDTTMIYAKTSLEDVKTGHKKYVV